VSLLHLLHKLNELPDSKDKRKDLEGIEIQLLEQV